MQAKRFNTPIPEKAKLAAKSHQLLTASLYSNVKCTRPQICNLQSAIRLGPGTSQRHHARFDLGLVFLPPAAATNAFKQHEQSFRMVEARFHTIGKSHQRAATAAVARDV